MIVTADRSFTPMGAIAPWAPSFDVIEMHVAGKLIHYEFFQEVARDTYEFRGIPGSRFYVPEWRTGHDDPPVGPCRRWLHNQWWWI